MSCSQSRLSLGVYLLGALEPGERRDVDVHLAGCSRCRAELAELKDVPACLARVQLADVISQVQLVEIPWHRRNLATATLDPDQPAEQPSPELLGRLLRQAAIERGAVPASSPEPAARPRRWRAVTIAACLVLLALAVGAGVSRILSSRHAPGPAVQTSTFTVTDTASNVMVSAWLTPRRSGTAISLRVRGERPGAWFRLVAGGPGGLQQVASWQATGRGESTVTGYSAINRAGLTWLRVVRDDGSTLADVSVS
jgi:anti-sigma factor RsiW